ncbi:hypothetical protein [Legionella israelensis]|uniref:Uncharacterized protein n=1 Tax=Legionella israelensis TaxID=454 RepID=A0A0W0WNH0_9GAMM|nr:hypothetical protein [Legionella israelensis]KTD33882.1 hypothetical protein Lisr_0250 [Legionella israelensis]QBS08951.1 hypothetical protein E4T55_03195 [Legionella israelensis]SCX81831.1 hypothetical protein SAMN02746069_00320 [Legionella israelensis DSM 19235]STX58643.1 Uncharacterised protein [Legionella israelensis]
MHAVYKEVEKDKDLHSILDSINYVETFYADTVGNKERLSKEELEEQLSPEEFRVLVSCIRNIVALKPVADLIADKVEDFKNRLEDAQSLEEVEDIESEIAILQQSLDRTYQQSVHFPQDEKTAGALIEYLDFNHHIRKIAEAFNVQGKLTDDVLYATGRCQINLKF